MGKSVKNAMRKTRNASQKQRLNHIPRQNKYAEFSRAPDSRSVIPKCASKISFPSK